MVVPALGRGVPASPASRRCWSRVRQLLVAGVGDGRRERRLAARGVAVAGREALHRRLAPTARVWDLILGYNGFGRIFGEGGGMGGGGGPTFGGAAGLWRMFNAQVGGQIAWLLPLAAVVARRRAVADASRAADRSAPRRLRALRRLGARPRRRLLDPAGHLPPVLRERAGARRGRAGRACGAGARDLARARCCWRRRSPGPRGWPSTCSAARRLRAVAARRDPGRRRASRSSALSRCRARRGGARRAGA